VALYTLVHRFGGPVATFSTEDQARRELEAVLRDEPGWADDIWIELFQFSVAAPSEPMVPQPQ
jgi:hypothetical protein